MELNSLIFPAPRSTYSLSTFPGELIWVPYTSSPSDPPIPCLYLTCSSGSSKILFYFHGNAEDIGLAYELMDHLRSSLKVHVLAVEYPGYGVFSGKPSAERIIDTANSVYSYFVDSLQVNPRNILIFGRSIGSGPATWLAAHRKPGVLILMSAYTSLRSVVKSLVGSLLMRFVKERFENIKLMPEITCPTFIVHGQRDSLVNYKNSQQLLEACNGPCSLILPADMDHNEFDFFDDLSLPLSSFLIQCGISVYPESVLSAFIRVPENVFAPPS